MKFTIHLLIYFILSFSYAWSDQHSLENEIETMKGEEKVKAMIDLANKYFFSDYDKALDIYSKIYVEAQKIQDSVSMGLSISNTAAVLLRKGQLRHSLDTFHLALNFMKEINYLPGIIFCYSQIGNVYRKLFHDDKAIEYFTKALSYHSFEQILDSINAYNKQGTEWTDHQKRLISVSTITINDFALSLIDQKRYDDALKLFDQALQLGEVLDRKDRIGGAYNNIGLVYNNQKKFAEARQYFIKASEIFQKTEYIEYLAQSLASLAQANYELKNYDEAEKNASEALEIFNKLGDHYHSARIILGMIDKAQNNYEGAAKHFLNAKKIYEKEKMQTYLHLVLKELMDLYGETGDYKQAYVYANDFISLSDSLFDRERTSNLNELLAYYELESKNHELELLKKNIELTNAKLKQNNYIIVGSIFSAIFLLGLIIALVVYFKQRMKSNLIIEEKNKQLESLNQSLIESNDTKDKFFSIIAHDLKNPLASIKQVSELLNDDLINLDEDERREFAASLTKSSNNLLNLLNNLLTWARSQTDKIKVEKERINADQLIENEIEVLLGQAEKKNIHIEFQKTDLEVFADTNMIGTVVRNLISNAIKFTDNGGKVFVSVELAQDGDYALFKIEDNGVGMKANIKERLFHLGSNRSERGTADEEGTGLGLIVCKEFVDKNDGEIGFDELRSNGSLFYFTLPIYKNQDGQLHN